MCLTINIKYVSFSLLYWSAPDESVLDIATDRVKGHFKSHIE